MPACPAVAHPGHQQTATFRPAIGNSWCGTTCDDLSDEIIPRRRKIAVARACCIQLSAGRLEAAWRSSCYLEVTLHLCEGYSFLPECTSVPDSRGRRHGDCLHLSCFAGYCWRGACLGAHQDLCDVYAMGRLFVSAQDWGRFSPMPEMRVSAHRH